MKFKITMKDPDGFYQSILDASKARADSVQGIDADERQIIRENHLEKLREICGQWFEYDEYLTIEIDTESKTAKVVPVP